MPNTQMPVANPLAFKRRSACKALLRKVHAIVDTPGPTPTALKQAKNLLIGLASKTERSRPRTSKRDQPGPQPASHAAVEVITSGLVGLGTGIVMADHDIHATEVLGNQPPSASPCMARH